MTLKHKLTNNIGEFVKSHFPTGKPETTIIRLKDGRLFFAPSYEFERISASRTKSAPNPHQIRTKNPYKSTLNRIRGKI